MRNLLLNGTAPVPPYAMEGEGGGGGGGGTIDLKAPAVVAAIETAVREAVNRETLALKNKNQELLGEKDKLQQKLGSFDVDAYNKWVGQQEDQEVQQLIKAGQIDAVIDRKVGKIVKAKDDEIGQAKALAQKFEDGAKKSLALYHDERLNNTATKLVKNVNQAAIEDVQRRFREVFMVDENGNIAIRQGVDARTRDGKLVTPETFNNYLVENYAYYFPPSAGGGAGGSGGGGAGGNVIRIPRGDQAMVNANAAKIAKGEAIVVD